MKASQPATILIVDAQVLFRAGLRAMLAVDARLSVVGEADDGESALQAVLTERETDDEFFRAIKMGAAAYLSKTIEPADLLSTIGQVARGEYPINAAVLSRRSIASKVLGEFRALSVYGARAPSIFAPLSPREVQILEVIMSGSTNKQIAHELSISEQTVKNHVSSILRKLSVNDRTQAVVHAIRKGWIEMPPAS